jgi:hypothetical protein
MWQQEKHCNKVNIPALTVVEEVLKQKQTTNNFS